MIKQAYNPYLPSWEYIPDGEPHVFGDRVYVYGSHDRFNGYVFCMEDYVCWSAPLNDLSDWRYEGVIYEKTADPKNKLGDMCLYAPDVTRGPDGRYYLYYVLDHVDIVSVAVCSQPAGRYEFLGYVHYPDGTLLGNKEGDEPQFDPGVITEGDVTYLYTGFCGRGDRSRHGAMATVLGPDMLTVIEAPRIIVPGSSYSEGTEYENHAFFEAPSIRKIGDRYYFVYSSEVMHELCYATSDKPCEGYKYGGVLVSNCDRGIGGYKPEDMPVAYAANNHGGLVNVLGKWYIFYHRHTNGTWYSRQGCAEMIKLNDDGSFEQAGITSCGLNGGPLAGYGEYPAYIACHLFNDGEHRFDGKAMAQHARYGRAKVTQDGKDGDKETGYIADVSDGCVIGFKYFDFRGVKRVKITTRGYGNGVFELRTHWDGDVLGEVRVQYTDVWETYTIDAEIPDGVGEIWFTYRGGGNLHFKSFILE